MAVRWFWESDYTYYTKVADEYSQLSGDLATTAEELQAQLKTLEDDDFSDANTLLNNEKSEYVGELNDKFYETKDNLFPEIETAISDLEEGISKISVKSDEAMQVANRYYQRAADALAKENEKEK